MIYESYIARLRSEFYDEYKNKNYFNAARIGERIMGVYKDNDAPQDEKYAQDMFNLARTYEMEENFDKAISTYEDARKVCEEIVKMTDKYPECLGDILNNLGTLYMYKNKKDLAVDTFEKAYYTYQESIGEDHPDFARINYNLGSVYYDTKNYQEALFYYQECSNKVDKKDTLYYDSLNCMGFCYEHLKDYDYAKKVFDDASEAIAEVHGENSREYLANIKHTADMLFVARNYEESKKYYNKTAALLKKICNNKHSAYTEVINRLGNIYEAEEDYDMAIMFKTKALKLLAKSGNNLQQIAVLLGIARMYKKTEQYDKAAAAFKSMLDIKKKIFGTESVDYIKECIELSELYRRLSQIDDALNVLENVLDNKKMTPKLCEIIASRLVGYYEETGNGKKLYDLYDVYVKFFPNRSFDDMLASG